MLVYFLIALGATTIGSLAGLGGGVIIKPILDFMGDYNVSTISVLSSVTVFTMTIVSIIKQIHYKFDIQIKKTVFIGIGSIIGGIIGEKILKIFSDICKYDEYITIIQNLILAILLMLVYFYMNNRGKVKSYHIENPFLCVGIGGLLGTMAAFLSIGGGPINVCLLILFFSMNTKEAAVNSLITIFFSQGAKLCTVGLSSGFSSFDLSMLPLMMIGGILGGLIGTKMNKLISEKNILLVFNITVIFLIILNVYNIVVAL